MKRILLFGGNGFIGAETVMTLLSNKEECQLILVNRGKSWDWDKKAAIVKRVRIIEWDRRKPLSDCVDLVAECREGCFHAVIDFSGYTPVMVEESTKLLQGKTELYIYISSDSVYEVCVEKCHQGWTKETDALRPKDRSTRRELSIEDDYGHKKLQCEEILSAVGKATGMGVSGQAFPYVILRLADVIGPRDSTDRWWQYQSWVDLAARSGTRVKIPDLYKNKPLSFVFVKDVARLIAKIIFQTEGLHPEVGLDQFTGAYNLACKESPTLYELIDDLYKELGLETGDVPVVYDMSEMVPHIYPSVERGPIDITKATSLLGWEPTPWKAVVRETVAFYKAICQQGQTKFLEEKNDLYRSLKKDLRYFYCKTDLRKLKDILSL